MISREERLRARILIIDDQQPNLDLLASILAAEGYAHITCLDDSREAAALYRKLRPELVLLDLGMPYLDGFEVMEALRDLEPDGSLSILVLTGQADADTRLRALASGARDFLAKPFSVPEVLARIRNLLEVRLLLRRVQAQNHELEERVRERTREVRDAQREVVFRLAAAAERRDRETGDHLRRMSRACGLVATAAGWPPARADLLQEASPLHDVGKIAIPDRILLKPGPLDDGEWVVMRSHTVVGA